MDQNVNFQSTISVKHYVTNDTLQKSMGLAYIDIITRLFQTIMHYYRNAREPIIAYRHNNIWDIPHE